MLTQQRQAASNAAQASALTSDLSDIVAKASTGKQAYTQQVYKDFLTRWNDLDGQIASQITTITCSIPCWWCVVECEICPQIYAIREADFRLNGDGKLPDKVWSLLDLQYWQGRNVTAKQDLCNRIQGVLTAWQTPKDTLDKILKDNAALLTKLQNAPGTDSVNSLFDMFFRLVPMHLAIAPRGVTSKIDSKYSQLCGCDKGTPDDCCGPDVGKLSVLLQLTLAAYKGAVPYIVDPDSVIEIICCLVQERYIPAKKQLAAAKADQLKTNDQVTACQTTLGWTLDSIAAAYKANIASPVDCTKYKSKNGAGPTSCQGNPGTTQQNPIS